MGFKEKLLKLPEVSMKTNILASEKDTLKQR